MERVRIRLLGWSALNSISDMITSETWACCKSSPGFSLIELRAVIAIIAILAVLLPSALAKAKDKAIRTICMNNEKQLYIRMHMDCDDNKDFLPSLQQEVPGPGIFRWTNRQQFGISSSKS